MLTEQQQKDLAIEIGKQAAEDVTKKFKEAEDSLNKKLSEFKSGLITEELLNKTKEDILKSLNEKLATFEDMKAASEAQGLKIQEIMNGNAKKGAPGIGSSIYPWIEKNAVELKKIQKNRTGVISLTYDDMKAAGIQSIGGTVDPASPYVPGISGTPLEIFDVVRNANFMINQVDMGTATQSRLAWINETGFDGTVDTNVQEGAAKPQVSHKFTVEISIAKKAAAWMHITEEFEQDIPQLYAELQRLLQDDVIRAFDDQIQYDVLAKAIPFNLSGLAGEIQDANLWDAAYSLWTQPGYYNFVSRTFAINSITNAKVNMGKNAEGSYLLPPFAAELQAARVIANKFPTNFALAGDLKQYRVRMLNDLELRLGWINNDFILNQFVALVEFRYHSFMSDNRRYALAKGDLNAIKLNIDGQPGS